MVFVKVNEVLKPTIYDEYNFTKEQLDILNEYFDICKWLDNKSIVHYQNYINYHLKWIVNDGNRYNVPPEDVRLIICDGCGEDRLMHCVRGEIV